MPPTVIQVIGKATGKAKAPPKAKAQATTNANCIKTKTDLDIKAGQPCSTMTQDVRGAAKGWEYVSSKGMTNNGYQDDMDKLAICMTVA